MDPSRRLRGEDPGVEAPPAPAAEPVPAALAGATGWLNSPPLGAAQLRGRVVLVSFWTYTCINWLRSLPYLRAWAARYARDGLAVVGVHTPEFDFERDIDNVARAARDLRVSYPIAVDSHNAIWDAFGNRYWPALYLADARGRIRYHTFGEGDDARSEQVLQQLLTEAGARGIGSEPSSVDPRGVEAAPDWNSLRSSETYLGYAQPGRLVSADGVARDTRHVYSVPGRLGRDEWALSGNWTVADDAITLNAAKGQIAYRFHARDLHLVMGPSAPGASVNFRVRIDGQPPGSARGEDVDEHGNGTVSEPRLHQLIRQPGPVTDRTLEITFLDPGVQVYAFTFG